MAAITSGHKDPPSSQESIESIIKIFSKNLENAFLATVEQVKVINNDKSRSYDGNVKTKKRYASDEHNMTKRKCVEVNDNKTHSESINIARDHDQIMPANNLEKNVMKTIENDAKLAEKPRDNDCIRNKSSDCTKKSTDIANGIAIRSSKDIQLKYSCRFCPERFSSLTIVRDHIWTKHKEANRLRKEGKYKDNITFYTSQKEVRAVENKTDSESHNEKRHIRMPEKDRQSNLEKNMKQTDTLTNELFNTSRKTPNINDGEVSRSSSMDIQRKYGCRFCPERFPSLTMVRDHIWTKHEEANRLRKAGKYKDNIMTHTSQKEDRKEESRAHSRSHSENAHTRMPEKDRQSGLEQNMKQISSKDVQLKYSCRFCPERFPSLTKVRDHIWTKHEEANRLRKEGKYMDNIAVHTSQKEDSNAEPKPKERPPRNEEPKSMMLYLCIACKFASISYDCMIEHCQDHIIDAEDPGYCLNRHQRYIRIMGEKYNVDLFTYNVEADIREHLVKQISCDYELLKNDKWPGIFDMFTKPEIDRINGASIYNFTRIIRLSSNNRSSSAPFMLYQCARCMTHVYPHSIVSHVQQNSCHENRNSFPCYDCERPFTSESAMYLHYKTHKVADADKKYKTIMFNDDKDFYINSLLLKAAGIDINYAQTGKYAVAQKHSTPSHAEHVKEITSQPLNDARTMIIQGSQNDGKNKTIESINIIDNAVKEKVADIYKCQCGLCFHSLESLFKHLENCHDETKLRKCTCTCGLDFDETQYSSHCKHSESFTRFNVRRVIISEEQIIDVRNMPHKIKNNEPEDNLIEDIIKRDRGGHVGVISSNKVTQLSQKENKTSSTETLGSKKLKGTEICNTDSSKVSLKQDDLKSPKGTLTASRIRTEVAKQIEVGETIIVPQNNILETELNKIIPEITRDGQAILIRISQDKNEHRDNIEENQSMVDTTMEVELRKSMVEEATKVDFVAVDSSSENCIRNISAIIMKYNEDNKTVDNVQQKILSINTNEAKEVIKAHSESNDLNRKSIGKLTNDIRQIKDDSKKNIKCKQQYVENRMYTEEELLKDTEESVCVDVDESLLSD